MTYLDYHEFIRAKKPQDRPDGLAEIPPLNRHLFPFQVDIVTWALRRGRAAIFADCGLTKTFMQLEWCRVITEALGGDALILAPLAVTDQTIAEGERFGIRAKYCRHESETERGITVTNYEMLEHFKADRYLAVVLDESSILKAFMGKTKRAILSAFRKTPFRLACTATPAPNDHLELGNHCEFLGVMPSNEMIARWFVNTDQAGKYKLKGHGEKDFWEWVASWAVSLSKPSDIGHSDDGFILPPLHLSEIIVQVGDDVACDDGSFLPMPVINATTFHKQMRSTAERRAQACAELVNGSQEPWVIWCNTNYEADALRAEIPDAVEVRGSDAVEDKQWKLSGFARGEFQKIITKPRIAGFGLNWQHCHNMTFVGLSFSYEQFYQATRRSWRFGQREAVNAHVIIAETELAVLDTIRKKETEHKKMQSEMVGAMKAAQIKNIKGDRELMVTHDTKTVVGPNYKAMMGDCVERSKEIPDDSVDFTIFSPPFAGLYIYSDSIRDMGNSRDDQEFFDHFDFLIPQIWRATRPGRLCAVHCKNLVNYMNRDGESGLRDFRGEIIRAFLGHGWTYHSEVCIWKDPVIEMQRTKSHGLLHKQLCKDSTYSRQGLPDYLVIFRKWAATPDDDRIIPVNGGNELTRFTEYVGVEGPAESLDDRGFSIHVWQRYASPVWFDVRQTNVLNAKLARDERDEKHICPLQLDVIARAIHLWTNPGDLIFSPFAGVGSEGYQAVKMGRRAVLIELKRAYFDQLLKNMRAAEHELAQVDLVAMAEETGR